MTGVIYGPFTNQLPSNYLIILANTIPSNDSFTLTI